MAGEEAWGQKIQGRGRPGEGKRGRSHVHCSGRDSERKGKKEECRGVGQSAVGTGGLPSEVGRGGEVNADEAGTAKSLEGWQL